jgi:hypothetical protein
MTNKELNHELLIVRDLLKSANVIITEINLQLCQIEKEK